MSISEAICRLVEYGVQKNLIQPTDRIFARNQLLERMKEEEYTLSPEQEQKIKGEDCCLPEILNALVDAAFAKGLLPDDGITQRDIFDTGLMSVLTDRPSNVIAEFEKRYQKSPEEATEWYYDFSCNTNYIRRDRIKKDRRWTVESKYGTIDVTINLSKPEKDPKAIAAARNAAQTAYPKCQLCVENEGYAGRVNHPARQNHRVIPITVNGQPWGFQYSPYVYYNEHCIVFNTQHTPMKINRAAFEKLFSFVSQFPHYFLGSNADLPIVGGSILSHDHFQGGHYQFAMERAKMEKTFTIPGYEDVTAGIVFWPLSVIRIQSRDYHRLIDLAEHILMCWRGYTDEAAFIFAETDGEPHNTITPIARKRGDLFELDLTLRNNITTEQYPLGVYHPHDEYHHIKKENIGLIEVMGLAVLPARLNTEMKQLEECLVKDLPLKTYPSLEKHAVWAKEVVQNHPELNAQNAEEILQQEIGNVFVHVLEDAGVYKCTPEGRAAFDRFLAIL